VESKGKVASITKYLNSAPELKSYGKFTVYPTFGHIMDLKKKTLAIDVDDNFKATFEPLPDKLDLIADLKKKSDQADMVWLASDKDFEGHAISYSIKELLKPKNYKRIVFNEITQNALVEAIKNAGDIDMDQVYSQQTRRILDRLVGFKLSPLLWKRYKTVSSLKLSAGRVQSCLLNLIIQRENEIANFKSSPYWHFNGNFTLTIEKDKTELQEVKLYKDTTVHKVLALNNAETLLNSIKNKFTITDVKNKLTKQSAPMPYITSSLQQDAPFGAKRTMALAQSLYEAGYITYMRTDSYNMSETFKAEASAYILKTYGKDYLNSGELKQKQAIKAAQEAHECIRITHPEVTSLDKMGADEQKLYRLIWCRTMGYLMTQCIYDELDIKIIDSSFAKNMYFLSNFKKVKFPGYQIVYDIKIEKYNFEKYITNLKSNKYTLACNEINVINTWTSPPARYNDAGLVKLMEVNGIARPATMVNMISKLEERNYMIKSNVTGIKENVTNILFKPSSKNLKLIKDTTMTGAEQGKYVVTDIGFEVDKYISETFDSVIDVKFTAQMEEDLDKIAEKKRTKLEVLNEFWKPFSKTLKEQEVEKGYVKTELKTEQKELVVDGIKYIIRLGPFGPLAETVDKDGKKKYIGLKSYLQLVKKDYLAVDEEDIRFLKSFPQILMKIENKDVQLLYGAFGLYLKYDNMNVKIPPKAIKEYMETKEFTKDEIQSFIEYARNKPKVESANAKGSKVKSAPAAAVVKTKSPAKAKTATKVKSAPPKVKTAAKPKSPVKAKTVAKSKI
jgi:DNA topoisomerase-1